MSESTDQTRLKAARKKTKSVRNLQGTDLEGERAGLTEEVAKLKKQVISLRDQLEAAEHGLRDLRQRLAETEETSRQFSSRFVEVEQQNSNLTSLYVASYQLNQSVDRAEALTALQEIVINLIGSEDFVIFERQADGALEVAAAFGVEQERLASLDASVGAIDGTVRSGEMYLAEESGTQSDILACIPMRLGEAVHGVIVIFGLLAHKECLEPLDHELFDLLASHAASSLCVTRLVPSAATVGATA